MSRRSQALRVPIAIAAVSILLAACSEDDTDGDDNAAGAPSSSSTPTEESSAPAEESSAPAEETSAPAVQIALPDGVLPLPETDEDGEALPLDAGRYQVPLSDTFALEIDLPQDTFAHSDGLYLESKDDILKVEYAGDEYGVPTDPCTDQAIVPVGPTAQDLVEAIRTEPIYRVSRPEPVGADGAEGTHLEIRIPAGYDASPCASSEVGMPGNPATSNNMPPGYVGQWWIFDVDGQRVVVQQLCEQCDAETADRVVRTVQGITFTSAS